MLPAPIAPQVPEMQELATIEKIANTVAKSSFVPRAYQGKPGDIFAAALYGREFGWSLMVALQYIQVIQGKPTLSAEAMVARIRQLGHSVTAVEWTDQVCTLRGKHAVTGDEETVSFSMDDANRAGLRGDNWRKYPKSMLRARATTMIARALFADAIMGISYTPEELSSVQDSGTTRDALNRLRDVDVERHDDIVGEVVRRRRKRGTNGVRCGVCDGYGADTHGVECMTCSGTGVPPLKREPVVDEYQPVESADDGELAELLDDDKPGTAWTLLTTDALNVDDLSRNYANTPENAPDAPLTLDVLGHLAYAIGDAGRADSIEDAVTKIREVLADNPAVTNEWAIGFANRLSGGMS